MRIYACTAPSQRGRASPARSTLSEGRKQLSLTAKNYFNTSSDREKLCQPSFPLSGGKRGSLRPPAPQETAGTGRCWQEEQKEKEEEEEAARTSPPAAAGSPATSPPGER